MKPPLDFQKEDGYTPLHEAAWAGSTDMVNFLIDYGAKVDIVDQWGQLALDIAKKGGLDGKENLKSELIKKNESKHQTTVQCTKLVAGTKAKSAFFPISESNTYS